MKDLVLQLSKQVQHKNYGKYRGFVTDNADPEKRARLRLRVPSILGDAETGWALPCLPFGGLAEQGMFLVPEPGAQVWVEFEEGELSCPIWTGTFWQQEADVPFEARLAEPTSRVLKTPSGHLLHFDDKDGQERIRLEHKSKAQLFIDEDGSVMLTDATWKRLLSLDADKGQVVLQDGLGNTLTMRSTGTTVEDAHGNKIEMAAAGVTVQGNKIVVKGSQVMLGGPGGEPLLKGSSFLNFFAAHVHSTAVGPTSPPTPPPMPGFLSTKVTTT